MAIILDFDQARQQDNEAKRQQADDAIRPLIDYMRNMEPGDLADFCRAACESMQYIARAKQQDRYLSDSLQLSCLVGANYLYNVKGFDPPARPEGSGADPGKSPAAAAAYKGGRGRGANIAAGHF